MSNKIKMIDGLVKVRDIDDSIIIDLRYATENNFLKKKIYNATVCVLQLNTAIKLSKANSFAKDLGYRLKVLDAYRPLSVQKFMWDIIKNEDFVAPPWRGSNHNRGAAVDVTLINEDGSEVLMPSDYDEFSERASINYKDASTLEIKNRELLSTIMIESGFLRIESEWWHFNDSDYNKYELYDICLEEFI